METRNKIDQEKKVKVMNFSEFEQLVNGLPNTQGTSKSHAVAIWNAIVDAMSSEDPNDLLKRKERNVIFNTDLEDNIKDLNDQFKNVQFKVQLKNGEEDFIKIPLAVKKILLKWSTDNEPKSELESKNETSGIKNDATLRKDNLDLNNDEIKIMMQTLLKSTHGTQLVAKILKNHFSKNVRIIDNKTTESYILDENIEDKIKLLKADNYVLYSKEPNEHLQATVTNRENHLEISLESRSNKIIVLIQKQDANQFVQEMKKIYSEINDLYTALDSLDDYNKSYLSDILKKYASSTWDIENLPKILEQHEPSKNSLTYDSSSLVQKDNSFIIEITGKDIGENIRIAKLTIPLDKLADFKKEFASIGIKKTDKEYAQNTVQPEPEKNKPRVRNDKISKLNLNNFVELILQNNLDYSAKQILDMWKEISTKHQKFEIESKDLKILSVSIPTPVSNMLSTWQQTTKNDIHQSSYSFFFRSDKPLEEINITDQIVNEAIKELSSSKWGRDRINEILGEPIDSFKNKHFSKTKTVTTGHQGNFIKVYSSHGPKTNTFLISNENYISKMQELYGLAREHHTLIDNANQRLEKLLLPFIISDSNNEFFNNFLTTDTHEGSKKQQLNKLRETCKAHFQLPEIQTEVVDENHINVTLMLKNPLCFVGLKIPLKELDLTFNDRQSFRPEV